MTSIKIILVFVLLLSSSLVSSKVLYLADTGFIVENTITLQEKRKTVWQAFTQKVDQWWPSDHTWWGDKSVLSIDTFAGGCFCEKYKNNSAEHMRIVFVEPNKQMRMSGGLGPLQGMGMYGILNWKFIDKPTGTAVTMTYKVNGINPDGFASLAPIVDKVQAQQLNGLALLFTKK